MTQVAASWSPFRLGMTALALLFTRMVWGAYQFQVRELTTDLPGLTRPVRVVHLTDLHYGALVPSWQVWRWVRTASEADPDVVVITGDLVDEHQPGRDVAGLLRPLQALRPPLGVWAVWGNHDHLRFPGHLTSFETQLQAAGVQVLCNRGVLLRDDLYLAGVDSLLRGNPDVEGALQARPRAGACLLLSHHPNVLPSVPPDRVGLALCGHTHGGQVAVPGLAWLYRHTPCGSRFLKGWVTAPVQAYVSTGAGVSGVPFRWGAHAEVVVLDLRPG
ncbi:putative metallophosphoesterase [Deinococcus malanensis]|uniref:Metallophosphoesterase n=1 Tax=Deinococcus malanensis TaxID=1706855 RepID=A0ABQ2F1N6_9DEIO|nr:metallophosphoesterase [Deinococcus malanensis]GGK40491.1 putative metallophosphoesterase [Deinococcus malanensis]